MKRILKLEISKSIKNKCFLCSVLIGCAITMLSFWYSFGEYREYQTAMSQMDSSLEGACNPYTAVFSAFNHWIGGEPFSLGTTIYFFVFPLLVAIPYGWSYCEEKNNGYIRNIIVKAGKTNYYLSKYIAVFLSGGLAMVIPLIFNFTLVSLFFPLVVPEVIYDTSTGVFGAALMSRLYYTVPILYVCIYIGIDFLFGGLIACISYAATSFVRLKAATVLVPIGLTLLFHFSRQLFYMSDSMNEKEISPIYFLRGVRSQYDASWNIILIEAVSLFVITFAISMVWERRHEVY